MGKVLSDAAIEQYRREGWYSPAFAFSEEEARRFRAGLEASEAWLGKRFEYPEKMKPHLLFDWADELVHHPRVLDAVEDLIGPNILLFHATIWIKEPHTGDEVHWHQDSYYFNIEPFEHVTAWVALADASVEAGCMQVVPGSPAEGERAHPELETEWGIFRRIRAIQEPFGRERAVAMPLKAGEMSFHHTLAIHGSGPNRTGDRRIGVGLSYIPTHVRAADDLPSSALLVRGEDAHRYHVPEQRLRPGEQMTPEALAYHREMIDRYYTRQERRMGALEQALGG